VTFQLIAALIYLVCGVILFFLGAIIFKENTKNRVNRVTSLMLLFAGLGPFLGAIGTFISQGSAKPELVDSSLYHNLFYVWEFFFPCLLLFSLFFPEENPFIQKHRKIKILILIPHLFHLLLVTVFSHPEKLTVLLNFEKSDSLSSKLFLQPLSSAAKYITVFIGLLYDFHRQFFSMINLFYLLLAMWLLYRGYKKVNVPRLKKQVSLVVWGIRSSVGLYAVAFIFPVLTPLQISDNLRYFLTIVALVAGSGSIAWAIIRHRFLDVRLIVRQSLVYFLTSAIVVGIYFLMVDQLGKFLQNILGKQIPFLEAGYIILAIIFFQPVLSQVDYLVKKLLVKDKTDYRNLMEQFSKKIVSIFNFQELIKSIMETLQKELLVEKVCLFTQDPKTKEYLVHCDEVENSKDRHIQADDPLILSLAQKDKPAFLDDLEMEREKSKLLQILLSQQTYLIIPLKNQNQLVGLIALSKKLSHFRYSYEEITLFNVLANQVVIAMNNAHLYQESLEKQRLEEELSLARQIQIDLLPKVFPQEDIFELTALSLPARKVGGDYYDFLNTSNNSLGIAIADATGKGMPAALLVTLIHASLRAEIKNKLDPSRILSNINQLVASSTSPEKFATMFYGEFFPQERKLIYCNAGHNYPILIHKNGDYEFLVTGGLLLGAFPEAIYERGETLLKDKDLLFMYSDGLTDAFNEKEEEFGEKRVLELLLYYRHLPVEEIKEKLINGVSEFAQMENLYDDLTLVIMKMK
jgi:serine phosphatase RsbU (regulator of sigma subunit)